MISHGLLVVIFLIGIFSTIELIPESEGANPNLYVSQEIARENLRKILEFDYEYVFKESTNCNSYAPVNYSHKTYTRYIDFLNPSAEVAFYRNEYPLTIDQTTFETSEFSSGEKTVNIEAGKSFQLKLLLFENRGPQNIEKINLYTNTNENNFTKLQSDTYITLKKIIPDTGGSSIYDYIYGRIDEDRHRSYTYPNKLGNYLLEVNDPNEFFSEITATPKRVNHKMQVVFDITFAKPMEKSNLIITATDAANNTMICNVIDAWESS